MMFRWVLLALLFVGAKSGFAKKKYPAQVVEIRIPSTLDGETQKSLMFDAGGDEARPLLVGLHTWSSSYNKGGSGVKYADWCITNNWHFVHPDFRSPNNTPKAMGSKFAVQDVIDAVDLLGEPATHLHAGVASGELDDAEFLGVELPHELEATTVH